MKKSGFLHFLAQTKLFWGLAVLYGLGVLLSPVNRKGVNIFLSAGNQSDVLRQVSINGIIAVGGSNLSDKHFNFLDTDPRNPTLQPSRIVFARISLSLP